MTRHIALIPARKGSKSILNKNLQKIKGKTLVHRTIISAENSGAFFKIILSTDIPTLVDEFKDSKRVYLHPRKEEHAGDEALMSDVVYDVIRDFKLKDLDTLWILQPSAPFREKKDYDEMRAMHRKYDPASMISVVDVGSNHPNRMYTTPKKELLPLRFTNFKNKEDLMPIYIRNGCFYVVNIGQFKNKKDFYLKPCFPHKMPVERSINIDHKMDLVMAQVMA